MNEIDWRKEGFKVMFRSGTVLLVNKACEMVHITPINYGTWMFFNDITSFPWEMRQLASLPDEAQQDIKATITACYCGSLVESTCDFCSGIRNSQTAVKAARVLTREKRGNVVVIEYEDDLGNRWATQFKDNTDADRWCEARNLLKGENSNE